MEIIKNILITALDLATMIIAIVCTVAMLQTALMVLKKSLKVNGGKASVGITRCEITLLSASELKFINNSISLLMHEFREFSAKVNYDRIPETIHDRKAKEKFRQVCDQISEQMKRPRIPLNSSLYENLGELIAFLKRSADSKEPVAEVFLEYKLHLPVREPLSRKLWEGKVIDKEEYWKEKYRFFSLKEGTHSWLGIELTYNKKLLEAPITSKKFKEFLQCKIKALQQEIEKAIAIVDNQQRDLQVEIESYKRESANMIINIDVEAKAMAENQAKSVTYNQQGSKWGGGFAAEGGIQSGGQLFDLSSKQNLDEAAKEIQQLLEQLSTTYPTTTSTDQIIVAAKAVEEIENNPALKQRVIGALKAGGTEALKELIDHPAVNILLATIEGWQSPI
ncbi:hypothetical protein [Calothrix sp. NIES-2098]|uniref:hypothetical protein n=1 Tax=Calothrix sp. NIES-2098 TaxID=1954171 RepID=UPI000B5E901B|nr:hypothetical protein NIES2098_32080 [Calothrix sp. NIES-2098]